MFVCVKDKSGEFGWKIQSARERKDKATRLILLKYVVERSTLTKFMFERTSTLRKQMIEGQVLIIAGSIKYVLDKEI